MREPNPQEISKFLDLFSKLDNFEAMNRHIRGWGILKAEELPLPEIMNVMRWLKVKAYGEPIHFNIEGWRGFDDEVFVHPLGTSGNAYVNPSSDCVCH